MRPQGSTAESFRPWKTTFGAVARARVGSLRLQAVGATSCAGADGGRQDLAAGLPVYLGLVAVYDDLAVRRSVS